MGNAWNMIWPVLIVVGSNTLYNICAKQTPVQINAFASLSVTYGIAMLTSLAIFFATADQKNIIAELGNANWATFALGVSVVGLEAGFVFMYRNGWKISIAQLVTSICLTCVLLLVGLLIYNETFTVRQFIGIGVCAVGLLLLAY